MRVSRPQTRVKHSRFGRPAPPQAADRADRPGIRPNEGRPLPSPYAPLFVLPALFGRHQGRLFEDINRRRLLGHERQLQVTDDPVDDRVLGQEGHNSHPPPATRTDHRINLVDLADHLGPALGSDGLRLLLDHPQGHGNTACLPGFPPMGIGVETVVADHDLALVGNMRGHPGDELQVVHPLQLGAAAVPVADPALPFQKRQPIQGQDGPDHVLANPLGFRLGPGPDPAVDVEARVPPGENALRPLRAEQPLADKQPEHLMGEDLGQPRVVQIRQPTEGPRPAHSPLGHQQMQVRVEVDPVAEGLDGDDDAGDERLARQRLKIDREGLDRRPAELPQEPAPVLEEDPQRLGDRQHHLAVRHVEKQGLPHPCAPLLPALGVAGGAESAGLAGERQQLFTVAVRTADPGEAGARIAAVEIALDDILDDRPEMAVLLLEAAFVDSQEPVEMMKQHPIEGRALRMARAVDSRHTGRADSRNVPRLPRERIGGQARNRSTTGYVHFPRRSSYRRKLEKISGAFWLVRGFPAATALFSSI
jgi:hypothetical protein